MCQALNLLQVQSGYFSAVRPGPMGVKWDYTGRLDNSSGIVTAGLGYTQVVDPGTFGGAAATQENGLVFF